MNAPNTSTNTPSADDDDDEFTLGIGPVSDVVDGTYPATLTGLERFPIERDGEEVMLIRWTFAIEDPAGPVEVTGVSSMSRGPRAKQVAWLIALMGKDARPGTNFRPAELIGRECLVSVEHDDNGFPKVANVVAAPAPTTRKPKAA